MLFCIKFDSFTKAKVNALLVCYVRLSLKRGFDGFGGCDRLDGLRGFNGLSGFSGFDRFSGFGRFVF